MIYLQSMYLIHCVTCSLWNKAVNLQYEENNQQVADEGYKDIGDVEGGSSLGQLHPRKNGHNYRQ